MGRAGTLWIASCLWLGGSLAQAQSSEIATKEAEAKARPRDLAAQTALGFAYLEAGRAADAERQLARAEALKPGDPEAQLRVVQARLGEGDFKRAKAQCKKIGGEKPSAYAHLCLARAYVAFHRSERAFEELDQAARLDPSLREVDLVRGDAHRLRSEVAEAEASYAHAKGDPRWAVDADLGLAQLHIALGHGDDAIAAMRRVLAFRPHSPAGQLELARLTAGDEALALAKGALTDRPHWAEAALLVGELLRDAGDLGEAEKAFREAATSDPELARAHAGLAEVQLRAGKLPEAQASVGRALGLVPNDPCATLVHAEVLAKLGDVEAAIEEFRRAADLDPRDGTALARAAQLLVEQRRTTVAAGYLDRLLQAHPDDGRGLALYGDLMAVRGERDQARSYYQRALVAHGVDRAAVESKLRGL